MIGLFGCISYGVSCFAATLICVLYLNRRRFGNLVREGYLSMTSYYGNQKMYESG